MPRGAAAGPGPAGSGPLTMITGTIKESNDDDMYRVCLTGGRTFAARRRPARPTCSCSCSTPPVGAW